MNFELILFVVLVATGLVWLVDALTVGRKRTKGAKVPLLVDYSKSFFPVILAVFLIRSFVVEPFKIPSGSMLPTLRIGDFIVVNKFAYGIRLPIIGTKVIDVGQPKRGDVMVFRYPKDPTLDYIKRTIGLPGDVVEYKDKKLIINGKPIVMTRAGEFDYASSGLNYIAGQTWHEQLGEHNHIAMLQPDMPPVILYQVSGDFPYRDNCSYNDHGFKCKVPEGYYFMMGDNRDGSNDSRYWGFVPDANIVGKAFMIWWNFGELGRIGHFIE
jgi:signal peptidase I